MKLCWYCDQINAQIADDFIGDFNCEHCKTQNSCYNSADKPLDIEPDPFDLLGEPQTEEEEMGRLSEIAKARSPYIRIAIGEKSEVMIYKGWKEISGQFGDSFRYSFEVQTEKGLVQKSFDCSQQKFAEQIDLIPFGATVIIHRNRKLDANNNVIEGKSVYIVEEVRE